MDDLDPRIAEWRGAITRGRAVSDADADELEGHLREQVADLETAGLDADEAFVIAVKRLGSVDRVAAEYAREHGDRLWQQLVLPPADTGEEPSGRRRLIEMLAFAVLAAVGIQVARIAAGIPGSEPAPWFVRNLSLFVLPVLAAYLAVLRRMSWRAGLVLAAIVVGFALVVNLYPFPIDSPSGVTVFGLPAARTPRLSSPSICRSCSGSSWRSPTSPARCDRRRGGWMPFASPANGPSTTC